MPKKILPVSAIITTYKTKGFALKALGAIFSANFLPQQVIVVDNNSEDGTIEELRAVFPQVEYVQNKKDLGYAGANNLAMRSYANQPYFWLLSSDTETGKDTLRDLYEYMESHPNIGALGPQLVYPDGSLQSVGGFFPNPLNVFWYLFAIVKLLPKKFIRRLKLIGIYPQAIPESGLELDYVTGAAIFLRRKALDSVGLLCEDFYMYFEDTDLCFRIRAAGYACKVINCDPVMHVYGGSFKTPHNERRLRITLQSLRLFVKKHNTGLSCAIMLIEIFLFGRLSIFVKRLKNL